MVIPDIILEAHRLYMSGLTLTEVSKKVGISRDRIHRSFRKYSLETKKLSKLLSSADVDAVCKKYLKGRTKESLADEFNVSSWVIANILKASKIGTIHNQQRRTLLGCGNNFEYFKDMTKEGPAYFYGLLLSDGNLSGNIVQIGLQRDDRYILESLKEELNLTGNTVADYDLLVKKTGNTSHVSSLRFMDKRIADSLREYGLSERKSGKEVLPNVIRLNRHFWRGVVDGDGFVSLNGNKVSTGIIGSKEICEGFLNFCKFYRPDTKAKVRKHSSSDLYLVTVSSSIAKTILEVMYLQDVQFSITRKRDKVVSLTSST